MKCVKIPNKKNLRLTVKKDVENVTMTTSDKIMKKNDDSPQSFQEHAVSDYDTPLIEKQCANNAEDSPMLNYYPSPTLLPFTQEGGNEIAWDWQSSLNKTPDRSKKNAQCDTPKGTKLLQRKRNSNSPLLYKPLKRKIIKTKNMENIGQFAAELQALNEKVRFIKQNDKSHSDDHEEEEEASILINTSNEQEVSRVTNNEQNCIRETNNDGNILRKNISGTYDDLFDESVDESMIKCTQEMEEKFNLIAEKENFTQANVEKKESSRVSEATVKTSVEPISNENSKEKSPIKIILHKGTNNSNTLKTYSRLPLKKDANSSIYAATQRDKDRQIADKSYLNNNNSMINSHIKSCDNKKLSKHYSTEVFDFPDDSFDDCLATCVEDEKLLFNDSITHRTKSENTKFETSYKHLTHASLKSEVKSINSLKSTVKVEPPSSIFENRKFFKTKSLSDQYFAQIAHTSVSRNSIVTNDRKVEGSAISLMRSADHTHGSNVNRCAVKEGGDRFIKHYSTGNIKTDTKETTKTGSQPARCTAEEIEKKRQQALMKLQMKRKLQSMNVTNNIHR